MSEHLTLSELRHFDPSGREVGRNWRYCCPICGRAKPRDHEHRSLAVENSTGLWHCHRCQNDGKLRDFWIHRDGKKDTSRLVFPEPSSLAEPPQGLDEKYRRFRRLFDGSPGQGYLEGRGIPPGIAQAAGVGYCSSWGHWDRDGERFIRTGESRRVVFPIRRADAVLVAVQGRAITAEEPGPKSMSRGPVGSGCFATAGAWDAPAVILCEGPVNALSLAAAGYPALATLGTSLPVWLAKRLSGRPVFIATDHDEVDPHTGVRPGDAAAARWAEMLEIAGAVSYRLRPPDIRDWNDLLCEDAPALQSLLAEQVDAILNPADLLQ